MREGAGKDRKLEKIVKRDGRLVPFDKSKITFAILQAAVAVGGRDRKTAEAITNRVVEVLESRHAPGSYPTVEEVQDVVEKELIEAGHAKTAKAYIVYRYEHSLKRAGRESLTYSSENIPYRKLWEALSWAVDNNCFRIAHIRDYVESGRYEELVAKSEAFYRSELEGLRKTLEKELDEIAVMIVAGPSSSGKTTSTIKVSEILKKEGKRPVPINVDNYFFDLETHPRNSFGDYDFETPQAFDLELLNDHLSRLLDGEEAEVPYYNFKSGRREGVAEKIRLEKDDILILDCLHGLYEEMTKTLPEEKTFKVYVETLSQIKDDYGRFIRWSDIRMMRRMIRDMEFRNYKPRQTLLHWNLVRRSELRYIISRIKYADVIVNSFFPSELPIWKKRLAPFFPQFIEDLRGEAEREDALERAERCKQLLDSLPEIEDESLIPSDSLLREFMGSSIYDY